MPFDITTDFIKYKFRDLKVYSSTEWLSDNKKKYRQVFDRFNTAYIYVELSFYNKLFDESDWEVDVEFVCYTMKKGKKEICRMSVHRTVSKYDNVMFVREGWGNPKEGSFWKKGTYYWEVSVDGQKIGTKIFYIEDFGKDVQFGTLQSAVEIKSIKLYEGAYEDNDDFERKFYKTFHKEETRYIYVETILENLHQGKSWHCEVFTKFHNNAKELKGQIVRLEKVEKYEQEIRILACLGSNIKGTWRKDSYTAEIVFMDKLLATVSFDINDDFAEGTPTILLPDQHFPVVFKTSEETEEPVSNIIHQLDNLIGLQNIKQKVRDHAKYIQFLQLRRERGFPEKEEINVNSVFIGNPGTGKTTVANMMGKLYKKMGVLSKGHVHEVDRVDLVGEYIGQTAPKVKEAIEKARGGVLFIDEAYSLARTNDDSKDFGREVIEILVKEMSNGAGDMAVIVAGYPKEMKHFLDSNPGLKSRFKLYFEFQDYLPQELSLIADFACQQKHLQLLPDSKQYLDELITEAYRNRNRTFGNARFVYDLVEQAKLNLGLRVMDNDNPKLLTQEQITYVTLEDVKKINVNAKKVLPHIPIDQKLLDDSLAELNSLIGMQPIKAQIHELVRLVKFYRETSKDVLNKFFLHTVFVGNPGTGKTTVARILTRIYKSLGVLERGHIVETDRQGLVAGFVGQTAIKTAEKIDEAMGGVLFIDEAYALTSVGSAGVAHGDFGNEAIQTLLKRMEDQRGEFFVFVAGYPDNMETFLKANPGLKSRFDKTLHFEDYTPAELFEIAKQMLAKEKLIPNEEALEHLEKYLNLLHDYRDKYFGNARTIRSIVSDISKYQSLRLANLPVENRTETAIHEVLQEDIASFKLDKSGLVYTKKGIGYKK